MAKISTAFYAMVYVFIHSSKALAVSNPISLNYSLASALTKCRNESNYKDIEQIRCFITEVTSFALDLMGALAFIMILYASIIYLISYGDEAKAEIAKKTLIWSVIGIIAVVAAKSILYIIHNAFKP